MQKLPIKDLFCMFQKQNKLIYSTTDKISSQKPKTQFDASRMLYFSIHFYLRHNRSENVLIFPLSDEARIFVLQTE